jgi:hypothetical protein
VTSPPIITNPPTTTTTIAPRASWLPPAGVSTPLYLDVPQPVDIAAQQLLPLVREAPTAPTVADADGDGRAGITLARAQTSALTFALAAPTEARIQGQATATVFASTPALLHCCRSRSTSVRSTPRSPPAGRCDLRWTSPPMRPPTCCCRSTPCSTRPT